MVKDKRNLTSYSEIYDIAAIAELAAMAVRHVAYEENCPIHGRDIPGGTHSDMDCNVWEQIVEAVRLGVEIGKGKDVSDSLFLRVN